MPVAAFALRLAFLLTVALGGPVAMAVAKAGAAFALGLAFLMTMALGGLTCRSVRPSRSRRRVAVIATMPRRFLPRSVSPSLPLALAGVGLRRIDDR